MTTGEDATSEESSSTTGDESGPVTRRRLLAATGAAAVTGLAGCSGGGGGDDGGDATATDTTDTAATTEAASTTATTGGDATTTGESAETTTTTGGGGDGYPQEAMGSIRENTIEELEIVGWESEPADGNYVVTLYIENNGDQETELIGYWYLIPMFDADGNEIPTGGFGGPRRETTSPGPGEVGVFPVEATLQNDNPEDVASYEIVMNCTLSEEQAYCEGG